MTVLRRFLSEHSTLRRILSLLALLILWMAMEKLLYFHPEYFRPENHHFSWSRVGIAYAGCFLLLIPPYLPRFLPLTKHSASVFYFALLGVLSQIIQWMVADQGVSGWDVLGRFVTCFVIAAILADAWPKAFGQSDSSTTQANTNCSTS